MKRLLFIVISLLSLCLCLAACGSEKEEPNKDNPVPQTTQSEADNSETEIPEVKDEEIYEIVDAIYTQNSSGAFGTAYIKLPELASMHRGAGQVVDQSNDILILMGGQHKTNPVITTDEIDEVLNDFFYQPIDVLSKYRRVVFDNYKFSISETEKMTVNDYQMCKYKGEHTFTYESVPDKMNYVAVVAKLKINGAYVYWIVLDESEEQNQSKEIDKVASKIAETLYDEQW